jgi:hypothetical protein
VKVLYQRQFGGSVYKCAWLDLKVCLEPRDLWVGVYWERDTIIRLHVCLVPMVTRRKRFRFFLIRHGIIRPRDVDELLQAIYFPAFRKLADMLPEDSPLWQRPPVEP